MTPLALCIERINCPHNLPQFTQCVVISGDSPGLGLDRFAQISWQRSDELACEFWLSHDDRVMLMRPSSDAPQLTLIRSSRSLEIPAGKPVVLLDQDLLESPVGSFRLHFHGPASAIHPPKAFRPLSKAASIAATIALSASLLSCEKKQEPPPKIDVLDSPPKVAVPDPPTKGSASPRGSNEKPSGRPPGQ